MITPFKSDFSCDWEALGRMIDYVIDGGTDYIVALGTTAETPTLSHEERNEVLRFTRERVAGRVPIVVGAGGNDTLRLIEQIKEMDLEGVDALLSVTPYYNKPSQEGLYRHFKAVAEASPLPIILYNVPGRTGVNMTAETTCRLAADVENIIGIKEASGKIDQIAQIIKNRPKDFLVLSGDDGMTVDYRALSDADAVAEFHIGADMGVRPDLDIGAENRTVFHNCRVMDFSHFKASLNQRCLRTRYTAAAAQNRTDEKIRICGYNAWFLCMLSIRMTTR